MILTASYKKISDKEVEEEVIVKRIISIDLIDEEIKTLEVEIANLSNTLTESKKKRAEIEKVLRKT